MDDRNGGLACGATCVSQFDDGSTVTLTATPTGQSRFAGWRGDCSGTGACVVSMTGNRSVTATGTAVADFNHDGIDDFVTADYHGNSVSVMLGTGQGDAYMLRPSTSYPTVAGAETSTQENIPLLGSSSGSSSVFTT